MEAIPMKMKTEETIKLIKYVTGSVAAVLLAAAMQLQFAYAAGIITLLTIQDTKKETVRITAKRMIIFVIMTILSAVIFPLAGYHVWAFGIVLIPYLFSCMALDMKEAIAPIAVLCTHYVSAKSCSPSMILNEFLILVIGAGIGTLWNLYMPDGRRQLLDYQKTVDDKIVYILHRMAIYIELEDKTDYTGSCFDELDAMLVNLKKEALRYMNNHLITEDDYYYEYPNDYYGDDYYQSYYNDYRRSISMINWQRFFMQYRLTNWQVNMIMDLNRQFDSYNVWSSYYRMNQTNVNIFTT